MMKGRKFTGICGFVVLLVVAMLPGAASAWSIYNYGGTLYGIQEGNNKIPLGLTKKEATKTAHKINKALAKDKGFFDSGTGPCHDPKSGVLC
ncbi:MAG: hypothetical protein WBW73_06205 [Rhodoplanes sp.]